MKGKVWNVAVLPGDGTGPEVIAAAIMVLGAVTARYNINMKITYGDAGLYCIGKYKTNLPAKTIALLRKSHCVLKGPMTTPEGAGSLVSAAVKIRKMFVLYADVRPAKTIPGVESLRPYIDIIIVRENTEGMYSGQEYMKDKDTAIALRVITRKASARIGRFALELSMKRKKHLTIVHKGNILKLSDALFKDTILKEARKYKSVKVDDAHVDAMSQWLIKNPEIYDVIVTENLFGDILSDESAMLVGGVGVGPSANIGDKFAMFEPVHGSAPKYAGMDRANPIATILSVKMMLDWMGYHDAANSVQKAVERSIAKGVKTVDLGGKSRCSEVGRYVASMIK